MSPKAVLRATAVCAALLATAATTWATPPWNRLVSFHTVEADPAKEYALTEQQGPWMILASSFSGEGAEQQARDLALELRRRYKIEAFTYRARFEFGQTQGRGLNRHGGPMRMQHRVDNLEEIAVLAGNFTCVDSPEAQRVLQTIKYAQPECLDVGAGERTNQSLAGWRLAQRKLQEALGSEQKKRGPMGHAFITTNPLLPEGHLQPGTVDPLVLEMNRHVTHSLLDCPGKYTVQVATFKGNVILDQREIQAVQNGEPLPSKLADAAMNANKLTEALRLKGYEAYEFHDRYASIVTVGSFDSVGTPRPDGKTEINPRIHAVMKTFGADPVSVPGQPNARALKTLVGIPFDVQPIPVQVPRRSISTELNRNRMEISAELWR